MGTKNQQCWFFVYVGETLKKWERLGGRSRGGEVQRLVNPRKHKPAQPTWHFRVGNIERDPL